MTNNNEFRYIHGAPSSWDDEKNNQIWSIAFCPYPLCDDDAAAHMGTEDTRRDRTYHCFATAGGRRLRVYDYLTAATSGTQTETAPNHDDRYRFRLRQVFETENEKEDYWTLAFGQRREHAAMPPSQQRVVLCAGGRASVISIYDLVEGKLLRTLIGCTKAVFDLKVCPVREDGVGNQKFNLLCSASVHELRIWNLDSFACVCVFGGHPSGHWSPVTCVAWHPLGTRLASGGKNGKINVWNVLQGTTGNSKPHSYKLLSKPMDEAIQASGLLALHGRNIGRTTYTRGQFNPKFQRFAHSVHKDCHVSEVDCIMWIGEDEEDALIMSKSVASLEKDTNEIILWKPLPRLPPGKNKGDKNSPKPKPHCVSSAFMIRRFTYPSNIISHQFDATWGMAESVATLSVGNHEGRIFLWNLEDTESSDVFQAINTKNIYIQNSGRDEDFETLVGSSAVNSSGVVAVNGAGPSSEELDGLQDMEIDTNGSDDIDGYDGRKRGNNEQTLGGFLILKGQAKNGPEAGVTSNDAPLPKNTNENDEIGDLYAKQSAGDGDEGEQTLGGFLILKVPTEKRPEAGVERNNAPLLNSTNENGDSLTKKSAGDGEGKECGKSADDAVELFDSDEDIAVHRDTIYLQKSGKSADDALEILDSDEDESIQIRRTVPYAAVPRAASKLNGLSVDEFYNTMAAVLGVSKTHIPRYHKMALSTVKNFSHRHKCPRDLSFDKYLQFKEYFTKWHSTETEKSGHSEHLSKIGASAEDAITLHSGNLPTKNASAKDAAAPSANGSSVEDAIVLDSENDSDDHVARGATSINASVPVSSAKAVGKSQNDDYLHSDIESSPSVTGTRGSPLYSPTSPASANFESWPSLTGTRGSPPYSPTSPASGFPPYSQTSPASANVFSSRQNDGDGDDERKPPAKKLPTTKRRSRQSHINWKRTSTDVQRIKGEFLKVAFSPDGNTLVAIDDHGIIFQWQRDACIVENDNHNDDEERKIKADDVAGDSDSADNNQWARVKQDGSATFNYNAMNSNMDFEIVNHEIHL